LTLDVKKSNSSNETPNVMTVGVEKYGLNVSVFVNPYKTLLVYIELIQVTKLNVYKQMVKITVSAAAAVQKKGT
jgi:hypothetical protein